MQAMDAALDVLCRAQFGVTDVVRRAQGDALETYGLGPSECGYQVVASGSHWRLRDYADQIASRTLLIVAAPIKRPYIWDLSPAVSAIRYCLRARLHVYLLEWMPASRSIGNNGRDEYTQAISACVAQITRESRGTKPFLIGHSLGGTIAAIFASSAPQGIRGLVLVGAQIIEVFVDRLARIDAILDAVEARHQHCRERQISVAGRIGRTELDPLGARVRRVHRNPATGGAVALRIDEVDRCLVARNQATIGVRGWSTQRAERPGVFQETADVMAAEVAQFGIFRAVE